MVNRISTSGKYSQLVADMQKQLSNYNKLTKQLASGSKLTSITGTVSKGFFGGLCSAFKIFSKKK